MAGQQVAPPGPVRPGKDRPRWRPRRRSPHRSRRWACRFRWRDSCRFHRTLRIRTRFRRCTGGRLDTGNRWHAGRNAPEWFRRLHSHRRPTAAAVWSPAGAGGRGTGAPTTRRDRGRSARSCPNRRGRPDSRRAIERRGGPSGRGRRPRSPRLERSRRKGRRARDRRIRSVSRTSRGACRRRRRPPPRKGGRAHPPWRQSTPLFQAGYTLRSFTVTAAVKRFVPSHPWKNARRLGRAAGVASKRAASRL